MIVYISLFGTVTKAISFWWCVNSLQYKRHLPSVLWHCWLSGRRGIRPVKKWDGGGGHSLVRMEWRQPDGRCVSFPLTIKSRSSLLATAHPGGPGKRAVKRLWCGVA